MMTRDEQIKNIERAEPRRSPKICRRDSPEIS